MTRSPKRKPPPKPFLAAAEPPAKLPTMVPPPKHPQQDHSHDTIDRAARGTLPIRHQLFLVHGEETAMQGLAARLDGLVDARNVLRPELDEGFVLTGTGAQRLTTAEPPRIPTAQVARLDWHNDASRLILDINEALLSRADEKARRVLIRRLQKALRNEGEAALRS